MGKIKMSDEQIAAKKDIFLSSIEREKELVGNGRVSHIQSFLNKIKELIEVAVNDGLSYKQIARTIYSTWNVKVSDQTVKRFAENTLGVKKTKEKEKSAPVAEPNITTAAEQKPEPVAEPNQITTAAEPKEQKVPQTDGIKHTPAKFHDI
ncbi:hypothetical protein [Sulfuricurvum sp.]|uniref:hypothetical protein n=1 Tax=Sulfuricurvum sp. TaxID=2025608 RepID=UPI00262463EA|nr:hypothetical protein [Sulfuricurvum sp.]MDD3596178.1 hypothetical protein [Sulfuricurvum sp.]